MLLHICLKDNLTIPVLKELHNNEKTALLVSVNAHSDVLKENAKLRELHMQIRFNEFTCFDRSLRDLIPYVPNIYLKYGGLCFLWTRDENRFKTVLENLRLVLSKPFIMDEFKNNELLERSDTRAAIDKLLIEKILLYKDTDLLFYRPKEELLKRSKQEVIDFFNNTNPTKLKISNLFERVNF